MKDNSIHKDGILNEELILRHKDRLVLKAFDFEKIGVQHLNFKIEDYVLDYYIMKFTGLIKTLPVAKKLEKSGLFDVIEYNTYFEYTGITPKDPFYIDGTQFYLNGSSSFSPQNIQMERAWNLTTGSEEVVVGLIDSGVNYNHLDLQNSMWPGLGWDFETNTADPMDQEDSSHGTAMAGIIAAGTNNRVNGFYEGIAGIAGGWGEKKGARIMALKTNASFQFQSTRTQINNALIFAAENGAHIVNMSLSSYNDFHDTISTIDYVVDNHGLTIIASSGNKGGPSSEVIKVWFLANLPNTIAVGAASFDDERWIQNCVDPESGLCTLGSNFGPTLDLVAPGGDPYIITTRRYPGNTTYMDASGTSASTAIVSGVAALMKSINYNITWEQIRDGLRNSAFKVPAMGSSNFTNEYGYGRVDAYKALVEALKFDSNNIVIENNTTFDNQTFSGKFIYVLEGATLTLTGTTTLKKNTSGKPSRIIVLGRLEGPTSATLILQEEGERIVKPGGVDRFRGKTIANGDGACTIAYEGGNMIIGSNSEFKNGGFIMSIDGGTYEIDGLITLEGLGADGNVLPLVPGTKIKMGFNSKIIIEEDAKANVQGTSQNPITFTYKYPQEFPDAAWDRIQLFGDGNRFEYVIFEYGVSPLDVRSRDNLITHSTFRNNFRGIDSWKQPSGTRSQFRVLESAFENHTSLALRARHADASIEYSRFTNELWNGGGIYVYASTLGNPSSSGGYFRRNEITNNRSHGLRLDASAIVYDGFGSVRGGNLIYGNDKHEIYLSSSTTRLWTSTGGAHSNIHSSDSYKYIYNLAQTTSGENLVSWTVTVENNFWGSSSGPSSTDFFGSVDYSPFLSTPTYQQGGPTTPPPSYIEGDGEQQLMLQPAMSAAMAQAVTNEAESLPEKERLLWVEQRLGELKELWLNGDRDERRARWLNGMVSLWQELPPERRKAHDDIPGYVSQSLELLMNGPRMELLAGQDPKAAKAARLAGEAAMLAEMNRQLEEDEPRQALFLAGEYRPYLQNLDHRRERLLLAVAAHEGLGQYGHALALLDPLRELAGEGIDPEGASLDFIQLEQMLSERLDEQGRSPEEARALAETMAKATGQAVDDAGSGLPESFQIEPAYPNPFNPSTQIVFALPERGEVRIRVYDIAGRLVSVLANQTFDAGRHQLTFDAGPLASGVYLIRGNAAGEVFTQRVTLIK